MALLNVSKLSVTFDTNDGPVEAVRDATFQIHPGECLGIVGESGSGKSQSFMAIMRLLARNGRVSGQAQFDGIDMLNTPIKQINKVRGENIAMIFQDPLSSLTPHMRIGDQMAEVLRTHKGMSARAGRKLILEWLDRVRIPDANRRIRQFPHELSGGMRQRVMIAQAMLLRPKLLIADEPTTALDVTVQAEILDLMAELQREENTAIALITHDMGVIARMCDRVNVMRHGVFVEQGDVHQIFNAPENDYTRMLLDAMPRLDAGGDSAPPPPVEETRETLLVADDIKVHFKLPNQSLWPFSGSRKLKAVDGVSFALRRGETLGIVGESGSGKSTLARAVLQLVPATDGTVSWLGTNLTTMKKAALTAARKDLQIVFQDPMASLNPRLTIAASVAEPLKTFRPELSNREQRDLVIEMLERVGLDASYYNRYPHELSGGQNQRVGIARAMINRPKLIICDEAVSALDVSVQAQVIRLLKDLQAEFGMTMLFITHDLSVVRSISHRILVLYLGRIVEFAASAAIFDTTEHPYTRALISAVPYPDPEKERTRKRIKLDSDIPTASQPGAHLRFMPSKRAAGDLDYLPVLREIRPGHFVAEFET